MENGSERRAATVVCIYEREQAAAVAAYCAAHPGARVIALDYWAGRELESRGVSVRPLTDYVPSWGDFSDLLAAADGAARTWYALPETRFLTYKGISLGAVYEASLGHYFQQALAYVNAFERILARHPDAATLVVPHATAEVPATGGPLLRFEARVVVDAAAAVARRNGRRLETLGAPRAVPPALFPRRPLGRSLFLKMYNALMGLLPRKPVRLYVSDHWRNIRPFIERMPDAELVFVDRKELRAISWRRLIRHRARFVHPQDAVTPAMRATASRTAQEWRSRWTQAARAVAALPEFTANGFHWFPLVEPALEFLAGTYAERVIADTDAIEAGLSRERINRVLVRASISGQHHFFIMGELPRRLGIPSVEIQHGIGVGILDPNSAFGHLHVEYLAAYGPLVKRALEKNGYAGERIELTGSPRFDRYVVERDAMTHEKRSATLSALGLDPSKPTVFVVMQEATQRLMLAAAGFTPYEMRDFIFALRDIMDAVPGLQFLLKFRSHGEQEKYEAIVREAFPDGTAVALAHGDAFPLLLACDVAYTCFSTMASECIMGRKPVVLFPLKEGDTYFYDAHKDGMLTVPFLNDRNPPPVKEVAALTRKLIGDQTFYAEAVKKGERYLADNFTFDGQAARRVAEFLRNTAPPKAGN